MVDIYCLSFNNPIRKDKIIKRFEELQLQYKIYDGVGINDERFVDRDFKNSHSCMFGHMDMILDFYNKGDKEYGIFCEDDIHVNINIKELIPEIIIQMNKLELDSMLLGYLVNFKIRESGLNDFKKIGELFTCSPNDERYSDLKNISNNKLSIYEFPDYVWGTQMYMISKKYAKYLIDKYTYEYSLNKNVIFSADWTITKDGRRSLLYPMLAVEENNHTHEHLGQLNFHRTCSEIHYIKGEFI